MQKVTFVMALRNLIELNEHLLLKTPLLGLDVGEKSVGLALSDATRTIATPMPHAPPSMMSLPAPPSSQSPPPRPIR